MERFSARRSKKNKAKPSGSWRGPGMVFITFSMILVAQVIILGGFHKQTSLVVCPEASTKMLDFDQPRTEASIATTTTTTAIAIAEKHNIQNHTAVDTTKNHPTVFFCEEGDGNGFGEARKIFESALPEYDFYPAHFKRMYQKADFQRKIETEGRNNEWDFFLAPLGRVCNHLVAPWIMDDFKGSIIYTSGESIGDYMPLRMENKFLIGPTEESNRTMTLTYLQMVWYFHFRPMYTAEENTSMDNNGTPESVLTEASKRPQGKTDKAFLIYAAGNCVGFRDDAFLALSSIGPANFGGRCKGPNGGDWTNRTEVKNDVSLANWASNVGFYSGFRFCLVMEHVKEPAYVTEKILMAFLGGCIPIYYGSELIFDIFNPDSFVYYDIENPQPAIDLVRKLEENPSEYSKMLSKPILAHGDETVAEFFSFSDDIGGGRLKTKIRNKLKLGSYEFVENAGRRS